MAFFDDLSRKITTGSQGALQKAKDMADIAKLNSLISDEEKRLNNAYFMIGKLYAQLHATDYESNFESYMALTKDAQAKLDELNNELKVLKGIVKCEKCGADVSINSAYCPSCAEPMPNAAAILAQQSNMIRCSCGNMVEKNMKFCTSCGKVMQQEAPVAPVAPVAEEIPVQAAEVAAPAETQAPAEPTAKWCVECGAKLEADAMFCTECGAKSE